MISASVIWIFMTDRANHREFVRNPCEVGQGFAKVNAGQRRGNGFEFAPDFRGCVRFWVKRLVVRRTAIEPDQDAVEGRGLRAPKSAGQRRLGAAGSVRGPLCLGCQGTGLQESVETEAAERPEADLQEIPPLNALAVGGCSHGVSG
jgi:hypothetical protein